MTILSTALLLFLVMDPFGNIPLFISALKDVDPSKHTKIIIRELLIALVVLVAFLFGGQNILRILQVSESALTAAGGTVLFLIAIKMIFPTQGGMMMDELQGEPLIVPLAIPYVAGPSSMAMVIMIMNKEPERWLDWLLALLLAWFSSGIIMVLSGFFGKLFGDKVLIAIERLMGMVLVSIAIQMLMSGIGHYVKTI